jgi:predicted dehydrogenase
MRSLIVGMGIGQLYKEILTNLGHTVVTVDAIPGKADYANSYEAVLNEEPFDTAHICTPNFTHGLIADIVATHAKIVFIEKPGLASSNGWETLVKRYPNTRFMMVKNNMWRDNIDELRKMANDSHTVNLLWINNDRVPNPGTWFTTKEFSYGGVSRDLVPHLLSLLIAFEPDYENAVMKHISYHRNWQLSDLTETDYGTVNPEGTYNVDDLCSIHYNVNNKDYQIIANWRSLGGDDRCIEFLTNKGGWDKFELGLCPEGAYKNMIVDALENVDNDEFWATQLKQDLWIHRQNETL